MECGLKVLKQVLSGGSATVGCHRQWQQQQQQQQERHQQRLSDSAKIDTKKRSSAHVHAETVAQ